MKISITLFFVFALVFPLKSQIISGFYSPSLKLAYNPTTNEVFGYFNDQTGYDEETRQSRFVCEFYFVGEYNSNEIKIKSFYPGEGSATIVHGSLVQLGPNEIQIQLKEDHGGCGNVKHFTEEAVRFELMDRSNWIEIKFISKNRAYFYKEVNSSLPSKSYLIQRDIVCIDRIEGRMAHCIYFGEKHTSGWISLSDLNN